jgi:hypothetical protein
VGYDLTKRISDLKRQTDESRIGRWGLFRVVILSCVLLAIIANFVLPSHTPHQGEEDTWHKDIEVQVKERLAWLESSPIVLWSGSADIYWDIARSLTDGIQAQEDSVDDANAIVSFSAIWTMFHRIYVGAVLRVSFVLLAFWPLWIISFLLGYWALTNRYIQRPSETLLGVCDPHRGPFYSGLWGPLQPNNSFSGIDYSAPGLACPKKEKRSVAMRDRLAVILKKYDAFSETNIELVQIVLAHADFPAVVGEENWGDDDDNDDVKEEKASKTGFVSNEDGNVRDSCILGLTAILEAHQKLAYYVSSLQKKKVKNHSLNKNYPGHIANLKKLTDSMSPLGKMLLLSLTADRQWAIGQLDAKLIATAYLSTEAGKSLVFKRHSGQFTRISNYPHLQARAVVTSILPYHSEYNGDERLIIRQAIICSRRHGDFGRAFLPIKMPIQSRALRDWLEILYADPDQRTDSAHLVELDGHIEEISVNWRNGFSSRLRKEAAEKTPDGKTVKIKAGTPRSIWKGVAFKSVVLMPFKEMISIALKGIHPQRISRISALLALTRQHQARISISARLPGFKRLAMEAEKSTADTDDIVKNLLSQKDGAQSFEYWRIVRRMLTKYNWLSTRIGDDGVPLAGLVKGGIEGEGGRNFEALDIVVPLRQRRFVELFGRKWEANYYGDGPTPEDIRVFITNAEYEARIGSGGPTSTPLKAAESTDSNKTIASGG